jgi:hypothetical protein
MNEEARTEAELPKYRSHKIVWALKIKSVQAPPLTSSDPRADSGGHIVPADARYGPVEINSDYYLRHKPEAGGYYVVYEDGYKSFSPAAAFESGYTLIER